MLHESAFWYRIVNSGYAGLVGGWTESAQMYHAATRSIQTRGTAFFRTISEELTDEREHAAVLHWTVMPAADDPIWPRLRDARCTVIVLLLAESCAMLPKLPIAVNAQPMPSSLRPLLSASMRERIRGDAAKCVDLARADDVVLLSDALRDEWEEFRMGMGDLRNLFFEEFQASRVYVIRSGARTLLSYCALSATHRISLLWTDRRYRGLGLATLFLRCFYDGLGPCAFARQQPKYIEGVLDTAAPFWRARGFQ